MATPAAVEHDRVRSIVYASIERNLLAEGSSMPTLPALEPAEGTTIDQMVTSEPYRWLQAKVASTLTADRESSSMQPRRGEPGFFWPLGNRMDAEWHFTYPIRDTLMVHEASPKELREGKCLLNVLYELDQKARVHSSAFVPSEHSPVQTLRYHLDPYELVTAVAELNGRVRYAYTQAAIAAEVEENNLWDDDTYDDLDRFHLIMQESRLGMTHAQENGQHVCFGIAASGVKLIGLLKKPVNDGFMAYLAELWTRADAVCLELDRDWMRSFTITSVHHESMVSPEMGRLAEQLHGHWLINHGDAAWDKFEVGISTERVGDWSRQNAMDAHWETVALKAWLVTHMLNWDVAHGSLTSDRLLEMQLSCQRTLVEHINGRMAREIERKGEVKQKCAQTGELPDMHRVHQESLLGYKYAHWELGIIGVCRKYPATVQRCHTNAWQVGAIKDRINAICRSGMDMERAHLLCSQFLYSHTWPEAAALLTSLFVGPWPTGVSMCRVPKTWSILAARLGRLVTRSKEDIKKHGPRARVGDSVLEPVFTDKALARLVDTLRLGAERLEQERQMVVFETELDARDAMKWKMTAMGRNGTNAMQWFDQLMHTVVALPLATLMHHTRPISSISLAPSWRNLRGCTRAVDASDRDAVEKPSEVHIQFLSTLIDLLYVILDDDALQEVYFGTVRRHFEQQAERLDRSNRKRRVRERLLRRARIVGRFAVHLLRVMRRVQTETARRAAQELPRRCGDCLQLLPQHAFTRTQWMRPKHKPRSCIACQKRQQRQ